ncbi:hypothetical protein GGS20DRAFT_534377 [Poronia punctata]|nr:hypothetical protein GGS20DRAFT_534377 [Poronia punctata]
MNNSTPTNYTPLETLFLFQLLSKYGFINGSFDRISQELRSTPLVFEQIGYDAGRLAPDALQKLAHQLLSEEQRREAEAATERGVNGLSPTSKKRKIQSPPLPSLQEAHEHPNKLPVLVDRLYARFRDDLVRQIREDEQLYEQREREIEEIERGEWDERINEGRRVEVASNGNAGEKDTGLPKPSDHVSPMPMPTPTPTPSAVAAQSPAPTPRPHEPMKRVESRPASIPSPVPPVPPVPPAPHSAPPGATPMANPVAAPPAPHMNQEKRPLQPAPSALAPAPPPAIRNTNEQRHPPPDGRPVSELPRTPGGSTPVLQHPLATGYPPRSSSNTPQPQLHAADSAQRPETLAKAKSPTPGQQGPPHAPALKWEPPYQPQHPPHQTPVPSPRPPYTPYTPGPSRPPGYPVQPSPQPPPHQQNYVGGRPSTGHPHSQHHFTPQGSSSPSHPVLLAPQTAGPLAPSLQPIQPNVTVDGTGQNGQNQRAPSVPATVPSTSNAVRSPYPQHQPSNLSTPTPVRPPSGLAVAHPGAGPFKSPTPTVQASQPLNSARIQPQSRPHSQPPLRQPPLQQPSLQQPPLQQPSLQQPSLQHPPQQQQHTAPNTPSHPQLQGLARPYLPPYHQQSNSAGGPDVSQRPQHPTLQPQVSNPQTPRPPISQPQTPIGVNEPGFVLRGHGTKWTATPTTATPRVKDIGGYFDLESPAFEPISPPLQKTQLAKPPPDTEKKSHRKSSDGIGKSQPVAGSQRAAQGAEAVFRPKEAPAASDPLPPVIKNEEATPQTLQEAVDQATGERPKDGVSVPTNVSPNKRKRQNSPISRGPSTPATHVLWTRAFHKISMAALDQIIGHRYANMFAHPIKPRLAPGYYDIILRPQDLKGIQKAITAGSKAASAVVATMPDVDANSPAVWLPISVDLVPPRGIINIAQLERELIHMFANAIMYNPDPLRGLGPSFLKSYQSGSEEGEDLRGYEFDENGVVKETRNMYAEVEKLLGDLRNEVVPRAQPMGAGSRSVSAAVGESTTVEDDGDEQAGDAKRRRIRA